MSLVYAYDHRPRFIRMLPSEAAQCAAIRELIRPEEVDDLIRVVPSWRLPSGHSFVGSVAQWLRTMQGTENLIYIADPDGLFDYWCSPAYTRERGGGDCDDFAILATSMLRAGGVNASVVVGTVWNGFERAGHAWVEGRDEEGWFLLEATSGQLHRHYRPLAYRASLLLTPTACRRAA